MEDEYLYEVFISYCRKDAQRDDLVFRFEKKLKRKYGRNKVWIDYQRMDQEDYSFSATVEKAIKRSKRMLLFIGSDMPDSTYVESEFKCAQIEGCFVFPILYSVKPEDKDDRFSCIPNRFTPKYIIDFSIVKDKNERRKLIQKVIRDLSSPILLGSLPNNFKGLPPDYTPRYEYILSMKNTLIGNRECVSDQRIGGFFGRSGMGKSVLANAFCRDPEVRKYFSDGIVWLDIKQSGSFHSILHQLHSAFPKKTKIVYEESEIKHELSLFFSHKRMLVVLDDVWKSGKNIVEFFYNLFLQPDHLSRMLVTSRESSSISSFSKKQPDEIKRLDSADSKKMMLQCVNNISELGEDAENIIKEFDGHTLSIAIACALYRNGKSWKSILERFKRAKSSIEACLPNYEYTNAASAIAVSVEDLGERIPFYRRLVVFRDSQKIPLSAVQTLWKTIEPDICEDKTKRILDEFHDKCLIFYDEDLNMIFLHDLEMSYLCDTEEHVNRLHKEFVDAYKQSAHGDWVYGPDDGYYYQHIIRHMISADAEHIDVACSLLTDYVWIKKELSISGCATLLRDYHEVIARCSHDRASVELIARCIFLSSSCLASDFRQLPTHLVGRLLGFEDDPIIQRLLDCIYAVETDFWLCPTARCMLPPNSNLINQWNTGVGTSVITSDAKRFVVSTREQKSIIVLYDFRQSDSLFTWRNDSAILYLYMDDGKILSADESGCVLQWTEGDPVPNEMFSYSEAIAYIGKLSSGEYVFVSQKGKILRPQGVPDTEKADGATAFCLFNDILYIGYSNGLLRTVRFTDDHEAFYNISDENTSIRSIAVSNQYIAIDLLTRLEEEKQASRSICIYRNNALALRKNMQCDCISDIKRETGDLFFLSDVVLLYCDEIFSFSYDIPNQKKANVAINEHWIFRVSYSENKILCADSYGHICCFDTSSTFVNSFNAYDSYTLRTMINTESIGTLETGIRGIPIDCTKRIADPDYRSTHGIFPVLYCMAKVADGIVYADKKNGPCLFRVGQKNPIQNKNIDSMALCAISYRDRPLIGFENGSIQLYDDDFVPHELFNALSAVNVMCTDDENIFFASGVNLFRVGADRSVISVSFSEAITHLAVFNGYLLVVYGNHHLICYTVDTLQKCSIVDYKQVKYHAYVKVKDSLSLAGYIVVLAEDGTIYYDCLGDFILPLHGRCNEKDRRIICIKDKAYYCGNTVNNCFALFAKNIEINSVKELEEIKSSVFQTLTSFDNYLFSGSQQDDIAVWDTNRDILLRKINADSILRAIAVIDRYLAFVSGSHIFWFEMKNTNALDLNGI